ncbi:hypothetical protein [Aurantimonas sp. Leaf443]|uniref:hypothetical protein n=1 Tax=Aurantimonas sp. Leaf443 TaxID=1736378 RepID=UPI0009EC387A|nr:hypothetical protein [Aurantimonas sp. Leaf443]
MKLPISTSAGLMLALVLAAPALAAGPDTGSPSLAAPAPATPAPPATPAVPDAPASPQAPAPDAAQVTAPPVAAAPVPADVDAADARKTAEGLPASVEDVQIVASWSEGEDSGVWRTVMVRSASDPGKYRFFLQQLRVQDGRASLKSTEEVKEINMIEGAVVGYRADEPDPAAPSSLTLFFEIMPVDGEIPETYQLFYTPGEPYRFGPASN